MPDDCASLIRSLLPPEQALCFMTARSAYLAASFDASLQQNRQLLDWATEQRHSLGQILGHRFVGLCQLRLDHLRDAVEHLQFALALAEESACRAQALLCAMQLGAALRRDGQLLKAYELFRSSLEQATLPEYIAERARIYGHYGSLLDQLGQRSAAADVHSRMEELCELLGNSNRLANARGLVGRSAEFRGDQELALQKYKDECRLAEKSGNVARQISGKLHMSHLSAKLGQFDEAEQLCDEALALTQGRRDRLSEVWEYRAKIWQIQGRLAAAHGASRAALGFLVQDERASQHAKHQHRLAVICRDAGLHGEALFHLMEAARIRSDLFAPLRSNSRLRSMAQTRIKELEALARELLAEGRRVSRLPADQEAIRVLIQQITAHEGPGLSDTEIEQRFGRPQAEDVSDWRENCPLRASELWKTKLLPGAFELLLPESRDDLIRAEVAYSATVNDLSRCGHLLAVVVERELRKRIILPAAQELFAGRSELADWQKASLGKIMHMLDKVLRDEPVGRPATEQLRRHLVSALAPFRDSLGKILRLQQPIGRVDGQGTEFRLLDLRNAIAHGEEADRFRDLSRLTVDAIKRTLVMQEQPSLLERIARLSLSPV